MKHKFRSQLGFCRVWYWLADVGQGLKLCNAAACEGASRIAARRGKDMSSTKLEHEIVDVGGQLKR